ncbi:uncharacterized protein LOC128557886 [Mercenaria mercenaria]|uniref:uncharacterized protein LOC128557886 n=1 Tax=Mercenaria mercenaria TaxID=6596 RepID=UPI00234EED2F|nr:uncharacterized protein LOC128557886 [Mercenaria mercenaria]
MQERPIVSRGEQTCTSKPTNSQSDCMAVIDRNLLSKGFSKQTRNLLASSWRKGTQKDYRCKFRLFSSWCSQQQVDTYAATLTDCADFLSFLFFDKGLKYRTINGYRSMLSSVLPSIEGKPVGQHPCIIRLLKGIFNQRPPVKKLIPEWDLPLVLGCLRRAPFEPMKDAALKFVTWKTCFLIAVTTFQRCSDLQSLQLGEQNVNIQKKGVTFLRTGLSKTDRPSHIKRSIFIPAFTRDKFVDPKRALTYYLMKTEKFRSESDVSLKLFLAINKPHKPVSSQTISRWITSTIRYCYKKSNKSVGCVTGHSTRSIGPSWAIFKGASFQQIMESADWSKETTFVKHYLKQVNVNYLEV